MYIILTNYETYVAGEARQLRVLNEALTYAPPGGLVDDGEAQFYWRAVGAEWIAIPTGLFPYVAEIACQYRWPIQLDDRRTMPTFQTVYPDAVKQFTLFEDQANIIEVMVEKTRGVLDLATNYGKTYLIAAFWSRVNYSPMLVLVPTTSLLEQTSRDIETLSGLSEGVVGRVGGGVKQWRSCTVAVVNSVDDWLEVHGSLPYDFETVVVDEGHLNVADRMWRLSSKCDAFYRFWMSGTPFRDGNRGHVLNITGHAGPVIAHVRNQFLVEAGRSAEPRIQFVRVNTGSFDDSTEFFDQYRDLKAMEYRNELVRYAVERAAMKQLVTLVFVEHKDHLRTLEQMMPYADTVYGGSEHRSVRHRLEERMTKCVIATSKWRQGVSIPGIDQILHAGGLKAPANVIQEFGRGLRRKEYGGNVCYYTDFLDEWAVFPKRHADQRWATMTREGFPVRVVTPQEIGNIFV